MIVTQEVTVRAVADVPQGTIAGVEIDGEKYIICNLDGEFHCFSGVCPHAGGPLAEGLLVEGTLICPWHGWEFDCRSGLCKTVPGKMLRRYPVVVKDGMRAVKRC